MSLYIVHTQCQVWGKARGFHRPSPMKIYIGALCTAHTACTSLAPERMSDMDMGLGLAHVERMLSVMLLAL